MIETETQNLYLLQNNDFLNIINNNQTITKLLSLPIDIQCTILLNYKVFIPDKIVYYYPDQNHKSFYFTLNNDNDNDNDIYHLAIRIPQKGIKGENSYAQLGSLQDVIELFAIKNSLYTNVINTRKQNFDQNIDILNTKDYTYVKIIIANHLAYSNNSEDVLTTKNYLPKNNTELQYVKVIIKPTEYDKFDELIKICPIAVQMQFLNKNNDNIILQLKSSIIQGSWTETSSSSSEETSSSSNEENTYYLEDYGYEYGTIGKDGYVWQSSQNIYDDNMQFTFKWEINEEQMNTLITKWNSGISFNFRCRYANEKTKNDEYIWRDYTDKIEVMINTPPEKPTDLKMVERT